MKYTLILVTLLFFSMSIIAQKRTFEVVSFTAPAKWQKVENVGGIQFSVTDKKTGGYAIAIITKATESNLSTSENFNNAWQRLVKSTVKVDDDPAMQNPLSENGWDILSGKTNYTDGNNKGVATLLNATGGGQTVSVVLMTNTQQYQNALLAFINSLELAKVTSSTPSKTAASANKVNILSLVGLWTYYVLEATGNNINGMPQYTAGYLRKEYVFYPDGTYLFRNKQWLTKTANILFIYETGTYSVNGNQLTITPKNGKSGFWGKTKSTKEWGKFLKYADYNLEKTTYTFEVLQDTSYGNKLILNPGRPTVRDGDNSNTGVGSFEFYYSKRELESLIDNPPGWKHL
ncbi:hypothetical protein I5M32_10875 [Pedobacter sp. SD-b]|uniref:Uncharacterized protein n=1 Tax=Pedobacter segetis TaxID=2793069 RepID=A0ABS1BKQ6_9SPHI|nr:hypothetical protein [Pedobacter segetis]MBK0383462.1 hypothetical protein [Pedobacter segetis]